MICFSSLLLYCLSWKEVKNPLLYIDTLELQKKSWYKWELSIEVTFIKWCRLNDLPPPFFFFFFCFVASFSISHSVLKAARVELLLFFQELYLVKILKISSVASSDLAKWIYFPLKLCSFWPNSSNFKCSTGLMRLFSIRYKPTSENQHLHIYFNLEPHFLVRL